MFTPFCSDVQSFLFRCSVRPVQTFTPFCSDVQYVPFRCSVPAVQMFSPFCSDVQYVPFRCSVRSVQMFSTFYWGVQSATSRHVTSYSCHVCQAATDRPTGCWPLPHALRFQSTQALKMALQQCHLTLLLTHTPLCVIYLARSNAQVCANASNKKNEELTIEWKVGPATNCEQCVHVDRTKG